MAFNVSVREQPRRPKTGISGKILRGLWAIFRPRPFPILALVVVYGLYSWGVPALRWEYVTRGGMYVRCDYLLINGDGVRMIDGHCPIIRGFKILPLPWELL